MLRKQIIALKTQIDTENQSLKFQYFCEVLNTRPIATLLKERLAEITALASEQFESSSPSILNLSLEQNAVLLAQINLILSFSQDNIEKCKKVC
jgi:hypothetical protein